MWTLLALLLAAPSGAQESQAELYRLQTEMNRLARETQWAGVERAYRAMVALEIPLSANDHLVAAQSAIARGDALKAMLRLQRVMDAASAPDDEAAAQARAEAASALNRIETRYGPVSVSVGEGRNPVLVRPHAPFAPDERVAVERAVRLVAEDRMFRGLLPVGRYVVDGKEFEVVAGRAWLPVVIASPGA